MTMSNNMTKNSLSMKTDNLTTCSQLKVVHTLADMGLWL